MGSVALWRRGFEEENKTELFPDRVVPVTIFYSTGGRQPDTSYAGRRRRHCDVDREARGSHSALSAW